MSSPGFQQKFQISPIILVGGIAGGSTGGMPINDLLGGIPDNTDEAVQFVPLNGGTLVVQDAATFPFANQAVASNAVIANPNQVSLKMIYPVRATNGGYASKLSIMTALQSSLIKHNASGGTYIVATPSFYYTNCLLISLTDISGEDSKQAQEMWQWDFFRPLLTEEDATAAQNTLMQKVTNATPVDGDPPDWSGISTTAGAPPGVGTDGSSSTAAPPTDSSGGN